MANITRTNPNTISEPFSNYAHVVTVDGAKKLVFCVSLPSSTARNSAASSATRF